MGKVLKIGCGVGIVLILILGGLLWWGFANLDGLVKAAIERVGSEVTATTVTVDSVKLTVTAGSGSVEGFTIGNPSGFTSEYAFHLDRIDLGLDLQGGGANVIVLKEVLIDGARINYENTSEGSNLEKILESLEGDDVSDGEGEEQKLIVRLFRFTNGQVTLMDERLPDELTVEIPDLELRDVGEASGGETVAALARQLIEPMLQSSMDAAKGRLREELDERLDEARDDLKKKAGDKLKDKLLGN